MTSPTRRALARRIMGESLIVSPLSYSIKTALFSTVRGTAERSERSYSRRKKNALNRPVKTYGRDHERAGHDDALPVPGPLAEGQPECQKRRQNDGELAALHSQIKGEQRRDEFGSWQADL